MSTRYRSLTIRKAGIVAVLILAAALALQSQIGSAWLAQSASAQSSDGILAVVGANGASLYDRPDGEIVQDLGIGTTLTAVGRTGDSRWVMVMTDSDEVGWAEEGDLVLFGVAELPVVMDAPAGSVPATTPTPAEEGNATPVPAEEMDEEAVEETPTPTPEPPTATPTNTSTPTPVPPTATPTPSPTPVPPTATPTPTRVTGRAALTVVAVAGSRGATLYDGPNGNEQYTLATGTAMTADARSEDGEWVSIRTATNDVGWVAVDDVVIFNVTSLPVGAGAEDEALETDAADEPSDESEPSSENDREMDAGEDTGIEGATDEDDAMIEVEPAREPTEEPTVTPTARPTSRPTPVVGEGDTTATVVLRGSRLNVRSGPGTDYRVVTKAYPDEVFVAVGRNQAGDWIEIDVPDTGTGWVSANLVRTNNAIVDLPVTDGSAGDSVAPSGESETTDEPSILPTPTPKTPTAMSTGPTGLGGKLAITTGGEQGDIYLYNLATGDLRFLTKGYEPEVTRDGSAVLFTRYGGEPGVYQINVDGSGERRITGEGQAVASPKMSPDGQWIVYSHLSGEYQCFNFGSFGGCLVEREVCPSFFPGCLPSERQVELPEFSLARVNVNGDEYRDLNALTTAKAPDWNEGGIVYDASTGIEITQDKPDGQTENVISARWYQDVDWQPGAGRMIFQAKEGSHYEIFGVNPDGSGVAALTRPVTTLVENLPSNVSPAWSPDGQHIVYLSSRDEENDRGDWRVWVMNADGSDQRPLPIELPIEYGFAHEQMVGWGP